MVSSYDLLHPTDLGLILSYHCACGCAHCVYNCGPDWKDWMEAGQVRVALQTALRAWGETFQVHLTGGEAFLNFPLLLDSVYAASELGIPVYAETSAVWAVNAEIVEKRFQKLKEAGLQALLISCSPFHAERVPLVRTMIAIETALDVFGLGRVIVYTPEWLERIADFAVYQPVPLNSYRKRYGPEMTGRLFWENYDLNAGGRAGYKLGDLQDLKPAKDFEFESCRWEIFYNPHAHLDLYGNYIPSFCGGISAGSWHNLEQLRREYIRKDLPPLIETLVEEGPYGLFELAQVDYGYVPRPQGYAGKCHLCVDVRKTLAATGEFSELRPAEFYDRL